MKMLTNQVALVTGGSRGIGKAIALALAEAGADVALVYRHDSDYAKQTLQELETIGSKAKGFLCDASDFEAVHQIVTAVMDCFGHIDILVNNAGITRDGLMLRMSEEQWDDVLQTNLKSAFNFIHACTPVMVKQRMGNIINISSVVGLAGNAGQANYAASKAGIIALTQSMAQELGARNIRVNAIAPGFIQTDMTAQLTEDQQNAIMKRIALRRFGKPEDVAQCALFLASEQSSYITGQTIICNGGMN